MRRQTRQYICAELLNYQRSKNELARVREKLNDLRLFPACNRDYTAEQRMYLQDRLHFLQRITESISIIYHEATPEEQHIIRLKFWTIKPRPTDAEIYRACNISSGTFYRTINTICRRIAMRMGMDI